jgi:DNA-binding response OmpR family regulator
MQPQIAADILLVEDDANDAELAQLALKQRHIPGDVVHVSDGAGLLESIFLASLYSNWHQIKVPKVILLDLQLKTTSGLDVLRQLKADSRARTIPVVVFTSSERDIEIIESYKLGVNSYVIKPADPKEFMDTVGDIGHYWLNVNQCLTY